MFLTERIKGFFATPKKKVSKSSTVNPKNVISNLSDDSGFLKLTDFFDYQEDNNFFGAFADMTMEEICVKQMAKIKSYRQCAMLPEVSAAIDIIVNEIIFSYEDSPLKLVVDTDNKKLSDAMQDAFKKILRLGNFDKNLFDVVKNSYVDGQIVIHCEYDEKSIRKGIQRLRILDPCGLYYDFRDKVWKYLDNMPNIYFTPSIEKEQYSNEEIARVDFGLYDGWICLSYLEYAIKTANILKSLEDLLLPLRFSRSVSRRVFNIDIGEMPNKRAEEYMKKIQDKFKYKKFYNNETGEISNQQHITSMVEDYWFAKRSNGKGADVTTLDESGNLGELEDIIYFNKKLYRALNIPSSKLDIDPNSDHSFNIDSDSSTQEDVKFMMFISRVRKIYSKLFKDLIHREIVATGVISDKEWNKISDAVSVEFVNENLFIEKLKIQMLQNKIESWENVKTIGGTVFSFRELMQRVFGLSEDEINKNFDDIKKEMHDKKFDIFYKLADIEIASETGIAGMTDANGDPMDAEDMAAGLFTDKDEPDNDQPNDANDSNNTNDWKPNADDYDILKKYGLS